MLERVQRRLRRLMLIGGLTLGLGIGAVLIAIVYRFFIADPVSSSSRVPDEAVIGEVLASDVGLGPEAFLVSVAFDGREMALAFRDGNDIVTLLVETTTMQLVGQFRVRAAE